MLYTVILLMLISILIKYGFYGTPKEENKLVKQTDSKLAYKFRTSSFLWECVILILAECVFIFCVWGLSSVYMGFSKNNDINKIRENGTKTTGKILKSEVNEKYSSASFIMNTYVIEFEINGQQKRSAAMTSGDFAVGDTVDIFYLPRGNGMVGGIAIADIIDESPGKVKIFNGVIELFVAIIIFMLRARVKKRTIQRQRILRDINESSYHEESEYLDDRSLLGKIKAEDKLTLRKIIAVFIFTCSVISFFIGIFGNMSVYKIRKNGIMTSGKVVKRTMQETYARGSIPQDEYLVEFVVNNEPKVGRGVSKVFYGINEEVSIYYLADADGDIVDIAFANKKDNPGRNYIYYSILGFLISIGFFIDK